MANNKTILCIWEIGSDFGHINHLAKICALLPKNEYNTYVALKDLSRAAPHFSDDVTLLQAPVWLPNTKMQRPVSCLIDTLLLHGYFEKEGLEGLLRAWEGLFNYVKPDLIIYDYAPTALLASKDIKIPKIRIGNGFADAEPGLPIADWRPDTPQDNLIPQLEEHIRKTINTVLKKLNKPPIEELSDIFACDLTVIDTFQEFDIYKTRTTHTCYAAAVENNSLPKIHFQSIRKQKIVAYLKPWTQHFKLLLDGLKLLNAECHVVCPKVNLTDYKYLLSDDFFIYDRLINLTDAIQKADLFVGHGNTGSLTESLLLGTPIACLPEHLEQYIFVTQSEKRGVGVFVNKVGSPEIIRDQIQQALDNDKFSPAIQSLLINSPLIRESAAKVIATKILELLKVN